MVQALVDGGTFVSNNDNTEPFDGTFCSIEFGVNGTDEFDYLFSILLAGECDADIMPAQVSAGGTSSASMWMTICEGQACVAYIGC